MSEKPEALRLAEELDAASLGIRACLESLSAAELRRQHADNERLRGLLREIADETYDSWTNGARAQRIAESALKEVPR